MQENAIDFIQFKANLIINEAKNDPIKKAEAIRDMVNSIAKISDRIKREIYIQECSRIMDISEEVLYNTLAQISKKELTEANKKFTEEKKVFEVLRNNDILQHTKIDIQYELEQKIIEILLLYGNKIEDFEDIFMVENEEGELVEVRETNAFKVSERIYLALQEDEVELTNPVFKTIYNDLISYHNQNEEFVIEKYLSQVSPEVADKITSILMLEERDSLHQWEKKQIVVKQKEETIAQYVNETILTLRWYLVHKIIDDTKNSVSSNIEIDNSEILTSIKDYLGLTKVIAKNLGRVLARF